MFQENHLLQEEIKKLKEKIRELQDTVDRQKERLIGIDLKLFFEIRIPRNWKVAFYTS